MKRYFRYCFIIPIVLIFGTITNVYTQSLNILNVDPSGYPTIKAQFKVLDSKGTEIRTPDLTGIQVSENGVNRDPKLYCAPPGQTKFSLVITIDISNSMKDIVPGTNKRKIDVVKDVARYAIRALPDSSRWECAITTFDNYAEYNQAFTNSKTELIAAIGNDSINPRGGTDYNSGFLYDTRQPPRPGALYVARNAKYKPVVIFLTDGQHNGPVAPPPSRVPVWVNQIIDEANNTTNKVSGAPATIFAMTLGFPMPQELKDITKGTPYGMWYETNLDQDQMNQLFTDILNTAGTIGYQPPCEVSWQSDCGGGGVLTLTAPQFNNLQGTTSFTIPDNLKPILNVNPTVISCRNVLPAAPKEIPIVITANQNFVTISGVNTGNPKFIISDWGGTPPPFTIDKGQNRTIKVKYSPTDSSYVQTVIRFISNACKFDSIAVHGGWVVADPFHCGSQKINSTKDVQQAVFCNHSGDPIYIQQIDITGANKSEFKLLGPMAGFWLPMDSCFTFHFQFTPGALGQRTANYEVTDASGNVYSAVVDGLGSGNAEISVNSPVTFQNASCKSPFNDITVDINNPGARDLTISNTTITGTNPADFTLTTSLNGVTIPAGEKKQAVIRFQPTGNAGSKSAVLTINSNAGTNPSLAVNLEGKKDSVGFSVSSISEDFGVICPNEDKVVSLTLTNTGDVALKVDAKESNPFTLPSQTWTIPSAGTQTFDVHLKSATEGSFAKTIVLTDECNNTINLNVKGTVEQPKIQAILINLKTTVGQPKDTTFNLMNTTSRDITINSINFGSSEISVVNPPLPPNWVLKPGVAFPVTVRYMATNATVVNSGIYLQGTPCSFADTLKFIGNPDMATADVAIDNASGYIGQQVQIPVNMRNPVKVAESGATSFNTTFSFDKDVLKYVSVSPNSVNITDDGNGNLTLTAVPVSAAPAVVATLTMQVLSTTKTSSPMTLTNSKSVGGVIVFREQGGLFTVNAATATLTAGSNKANPGDVITLPVTLSNGTNVTTFNQNISTEMTFDATMLEPQGTFTDLGIANGLRTVKYTFPINNNSGSAVYNINFKVMLGSARSTPLKLAKSAVAQGFVNFNEVSGLFEYKEICESGGIRLFSPSGQAALLAVSPNPSKGNMNVVFETSEVGVTHIWLTDILGITASDIINNEVPIGVNQVSVDLSQTASGRYLLIMQTPTQRFTQWIDLMK